MSQDTLAAISCVAGVAAMATATYMVVNGNYSWSLIAALGAEIVASTSALFLGIQGDAEASDNQSRYSPR